MMKWALGFLFTVVSSFAFASATELRPGESISAHVNGMACIITALPDGQMRVDILGISGIKQTVKGPGTKKIVTSMCSAQTKTDPAVAATRMAEISPEAFGESIKAGPGSRENTAPEGGIQ